MMQLPAALSPWAASLGLLDPTVQQTLGPWVQRLSLLLSQVAGPSRPGDGEPDGFDGIIGRGTFDRLLATEWLLLEAEPDEFVRRAAMYEQLYLRQARQSPAATRRTVALFDAGPSQTGAPRIAQLACLIVLARRAEAAGHRFEWGIAQQPIGLLEEQLTAPGIARFMAARTDLDVAQHELASWRERLEQDGLDEWWLVGAERLRPHSDAQRALLVQLDDPFDPDRRELDVEVRRHGRSVGQVILELPDTRAMVRVIREPLPPERPKTQLFRPRRSSGPNVLAVSNPVFLCQGRRVAVRTAWGDIAVYAMPRSSRPLTEPRLVSSGRNAHVFAVGWGSIGLSLLMKDQGRLVHEHHFRKRSGSEEFSWPIRGTIDPPSDDATLLACHGLNPAFERGPVFMDASAAVCGQAQESSTGRPYVRRLVPSALALGGGPTPVWVGNAGEDAVAVRFETRDANSDRAEPASSRITQLPAGDRAFIGYGVNRHSSVYAVRQGSGHWTLTTVGSRQVILLAPHGSRVVGVCQLESSEGLRLVIVEGDGVTISLIGTDGVSFVAVATGVIDSVAVCDQRAVVAWVTAEGELGVSGLRPRHLLGAG